MKVDYVTVKVISLIFAFLRLLFFSSRQGALAHNFILYCVDRISFPRFGSAIPDIPEIGRLLRNGRWKSSATIEYIRRSYSLSPAALKCAIENQAGWRSIVGVRRRRKFEKKGHCVPSHIFISPSYECNLDCKGCYAAGHAGSMHWRTLERIVTEQEELGLFHVIVLGGEPFLRQDIWRIFQKFPRTNFDVFTNGTLLGEREIALISQFGNVRLGISLDGFKEKTDARRGEGIYEKTLSVLRFCQKAGIFYGVSITVTRENFKEVTSKEFIEAVVSLGIFFISYFPYMPFGDGEDNEFSLIWEQREELIRFGEDFWKNNYPVFPVIGRNGSNMVTACPAADSRIHITASGDVEPCIFCQFAFDNIRGKTILEVMNSEFFGIIRELNHTGASEFNPCKIHQSAVLQQIFSAAGAYPTNRRRVRKCQDQACIRMLPILQQTLY